MDAAMRLIATPLASEGEGQSGVRSLRPDWPHLPHGRPTFLDPPDSAEVLHVRAQDESIFCAVDLARQLDLRRISCQLH